jgi:hypothetical protein
MMDYIFTYCREEGRISKEMNLRNYTHPKDLDYLMKIDNLCVSSEQKPPPDLCKRILRLAFLCLRAEHPRRLPLLRPDEQTELTEGLRDLDSTTFKLIPRPFIGLKPLESENLCAKYIPNQHSTSDGSFGYPDTPVNKGLACNDSHLSASNGQGQLCAMRWI